MIYLLISKAPPKYQFRDAMNIFCKRLNLITSIRSVFFYLFEASMYKYLNSKHQKLSLNYKGCEFCLVEGIFTTAVRKLIQTLTNKQVTAKYIHQQAKKGGISVSYSFGILRIVPSFRGKSGRLWRWDVFLSPVALSLISK